MDKTYYVYCHTNNINGKKYIGITGLEKPLYRWHKDGSGYSGQVFGIAIEKYGWNNFKHEILFEGLAYEDACKKEKDLIRKYKTTDRKYGYNISIGGDNGAIGAFNNRLSKKVYLYDIEGNYIREFPSMMEAERITGINNSAICSCCKGKIAYTKDYRWSYEKEDKLIPIDKENHFFNTVIKEQCKEIFQYTLEGNYIQKFNSLSEASLKTNSDYRLVSACCLGKRNQANGYIWAYQYYNSFENLKNRENDIIPKGKSVIQYSKDGIFMNEYKSIMDAVRKTGVSKGKISRCCNNKVSIVDNKYKFVFKDSELCAS